MRKYFIILIIILILLILVMDAGLKKINKEIKTEKKKMKLENVTLITIYDNYQHNSELQKGWGFSCLIKTENKNILFDTGADIETLLDNMEKLRLNSKEINVIVLSHIHGDHVGGLIGFLEENKGIVVYVPESFPNNFKEEIKTKGAEIVEVDEATKICDGIYSSGELGNWIKEQSLIVNAEKGLVIITGCAHPGVVDIIKKTKELINRDVYLVLGGFHLSGASDSELKGIITDFRKLGVEKVAPCHCSGNRTRQLFKEEYKENFIANGVGKIIKI